MSKRDERQGWTFAVYTQAERAAVYRGGHGKRVRRKRTDDTVRFILLGNLRAD